MSRIVTFHSFRRGTGKSCLSANTAALCALQGLRVGLVDLNLQSPSLASVFALRKEATSFFINDYIWQQCSIAETAHDLTIQLEEAYQIKIPGRLFLIPANNSYSEISRVLKGDFLFENLGQGYQDLIETYALDLVILDTCAGLNDETIFALAVSDTLMVIIRPDRQDYQGTAVTVDVARRLGIPQVKMIANFVPHSLALQQVKQELELQYELEVVAVLPFSDDFVAPENSSILSLAMPRHPLSHLLKAITQTIVLPAH